MMIFNGTGCIGGDRIYDDNEVVPAFEIFSTGIVTPEYHINCLNDELVMDINECELIIDGEWVEPIY
jgi:hypothetical protein